MHCSRGWASACLKATSPEPRVYRSPMKNVGLTGGVVSKVLKAKSFMHSCLFELNCVNCKSNYILF